MNKSVKTFVKLRARGCCEYCLSQTDFSPDPFSVEHIIPKSKGGLDIAENLAWACMGCNGMKYNAVECADPVSGAITPIYNPRNDEWRKHFKWSNDFSLLLGLTPVGRGTIEKLQINRTGVVNLRILLHGAGLHPPF